VIPKFGQEEEYEDKRNKVEMERKATFEIIGGQLHILFYNYLNCSSYTFLHSFGSSSLMINCELS